MTGPIEWTPAGQVLAAEPFADRLRIEDNGNMLAVKLDRFGSIERFPTEEFRADEVGISPDGRAPDIDRVRRLLPIFGAPPHDAVRLGLHR